MGVSAVILTERAAACLNASVKFLDKLFFLNMSYTWETESSLKETKTAGRFCKSAFGYSHSIEKNSGQSSKSHSTKNEEEIVSRRRKPQTTFSCSTGEEKSIDILKLADQQKTHLYRESKLRSGNSQQQQCDSYLLQQQEVDKENITPHNNSRSMSGRRHHHKKHKRTASLTDLRPEDKKKVANLIQELANLGSEKERIENCLKTEREQFEEAFKDLVSDHKVLLSERQSVQSELQTCQQMLNQLQEAVLHRPTSSSLSSQRSLKDNDYGLVSDSAKPNTGDFSRHSELEAYISKHNNSQDMDVVSELGSVTSDAVKNPR